MDFNDERTITLKLSGVILKNMNKSQQNEGGPHKFVFDRVFDMKSKQEDVYNFAARPVVESIQVLLCLV